MKKKKFHIILLTSNAKEEYNLLGEYDKDNEIISYYESNSLLSKITINLKKHQLIKENVDYKIYLELDEKKETKNEILLKKENKILELTVKTVCFKFSDNKLSIEYNIIDSNEKIKYEIEIGE